MNIFGKRIKSRRKELGMNAEMLAKKIGKSASTIYRYENGDIGKVDSDILVPIADALLTTPAYLMGWDDDEQTSLSIFPSNITPISNLHPQRVPLIGEVAGGEPIYSPEDIGVYVDAPVQCDAAITVKGDSMFPNYQDGDVVYIKCCLDVPEGSVAVVFLDDEATLKHVYKRETGLTLWSDNPEYPPMLIEFNEYNNVRIFGVPVGFTRMFKNDPLKKVKKGF